MIYKFCIVSDEVDNFNAAQSAGGNQIPNVQIGELVGFKEIMEEASNSQIPVVRKAALEAISYINEKLIIKEPPVKDKTIRAFPFRTSGAAFLSAVVACTFMLSFVAIGAKLINNTPVEAAQISLSEDVESGVEVA